MAIWTHNNDAFAQLAESISDGQTRLGKGKDCYTHTHKQQWESKQSQPHQPQPQPINNEIKEEILYETGVSVEDFSHLTGLSWGDADLLVHLFRSVLFWVWLYRYKYSKKGIKNTNWWRYKSISIRSMGTLFKRKYLFFILRCCKARNRNNNNKRKICFFYIICTYILIIDVVIVIIVRCYSPCHRCGRWNSRQIRSCCTSRRSVAHRRED